MTNAQLDALRALNQCSLPTGTNKKRFIRQFEHADLDTPLTDRQANYLDMLRYHFRRQLPAGVALHTKPAGMS